MDEKVKRPPRRQVQGLVEAYAKFKGAQREGAGHKTCYRLQKIYESKLEKIETGYPHLYIDRDEMRKRADIWWNSRPMKGTGVDW